MKIKNNYALTTYYGQCIGCRRLLCDLYDWYTIKIKDKTYDVCENCFSIEKHSAVLEKEVGAPSKEN